MRPRTLAQNCLALLSALTGVAATAAEIDFEPITIDPDPGKVVYAVTVADVDDDGRDDMVAVTEREVVWYEAPAWKKRTILSGGTVADNVCIAPLDIDRDGKVDFALGAGWATNGGTIQWLSRPRDASRPDGEDGSWTVHPIGAIPWTHRMRWGNVIGGPGSREELVVSPLNAGEGEPGVRLTAFQIPDDPVKGRWRATVISHNLNRMHNHLCVRATQIPPVDSDSRTVLTLAASREGIHAVYQGENAEAEASGSAPGFVQKKLVNGAEAPEPGGRGAGEIKVGRLGDGTPMIATIEPMHGTDAVVYLWDEDRADTPRRVVLTDRLQAGHALWCSDLDGDGDDEVVVGWRQPNPRVGILVFDRQENGSWSEQAIDPDGVACEDLIVHDLTGDGKPDILAGGRATHNVKLYVNRGVNEK